MQDLIRKHRTLFGFIIFAVIGLPMLFFGVPTACDGQSRASREELAIGTVGDVPVEAAQFEQMLRMRRRGGPDGELKPISELKTDGTITEILDSLTEGAAITNLVQDRGFKLDRELITARLKELPDFQNDKGEFDKDLWNEWVSNPDVNWNEIYKQIEEGIARQVFIDMVRAPGGRVLDKELDKELENKFSTLKVRYYSVLPPVEPTEEQIKAQYDKEITKADGRPKYQKPDKYTVDYVSLSLVPPVPQLALDIVKQAREGADFAQLADTHSALAAKNGGEMAGWQRARDNDPPSRKALMALKAGEVSDPVSAARGYFIYKVEEERTAEDGVREVRARQIFIEAALSETERAALTTRADSLVQKAKDLASLTKAVEEYNLGALDGMLQVARSPQFDRDASEIPGIPAADLVRFRTAFDLMEAATTVTKIEAGEHIYIAEVIEKTKGDIPPLDEVKDEVREDTIRALKQEDDYKNKVKEYADKIKAQAAKLDEIPAKFPELTGTVGESDEFKVKEFIVKIPAAAPGAERPFIPSEQVAAVLDGKEPGVMAGPVNGFGGGDAYFVELVERKPPTDEDRKEFDKERKTLRDQKVNMAQSELIQDFAKELRLSGKYFLDQDAAVLGAMLEEDTPPPAEAPAPADAPAPAAP